MPQAEVKDARRLVARIASCLVALLASVAPLRAQEDRLRTEPTAWWWYHGVSADFISQQVEEHKARIVDIEIEQASPYRFTVLMVENKGAYARRWWWYYGIRGVGGVAARIKEHPGAVPIDLEAVEVDYGDGKGPQYAVVLVDGGGTQGVDWWIASNSTIASIASQLSTHRARLVDLDANPFSVAPRHSAVMVSNKGAGARAWWWYVDLTPEAVGAKLEEHGARLVDLERNAAGRFDVVMVKSSGESWWWYHGLDADELSERVVRHGARIVDIETYVTGGRKLFAAILVAPRPDAHEAAARPARR